MSTIKYTTVPSKRLAASITASSSAIQLNNILGWNGSALTSADFGTKLYAILRNDSNTLMEIMELDPSTIASASITILARGLNHDGTLATEVTANKLTWIKNETIVELGTDVPQLLNHTVRIIEDQTVDGVKTFTSFPVKSGVTTPSAAGELATKAYVDTVATGGAAVYDQNIITGSSQSTFSLGNLICQIPSGNGVTSGRWILFDPTNSAMLGRRLGIAETASAATSTAINILVGGIDKNQSGLTLGAFYYASDTPGAISTTPGTNMVFVGRAQSTTSILLDSTNSPDEITRGGFVDYIVDTGAADAYVATLTPALVAYKAGFEFAFKAANTNTTTSTVNVNGLGAKTIKKLNGATNLVAGDIVSGQIVKLKYDGTNFQLLSPTARPSISQSGSEVYAADAGSNDTYAITLSPAPTAYVTGQVFRFKANTINTGAATLNVNSLGAITIVKNYNVTLANGDIKANQLVEVIYDGTNFQLLSPVTPGITGTFATGTTTRDISTSSGTQNIAHGLGAIPKSFRVSGVMPQTQVSQALCLGGNSVSVFTFTAVDPGDYASFSLYSANSARSAAVITADATNIILTWTKSGSPTGTANIIWEAFI